MDTNNESTEFIQTTTTQNSQNATATTQYRKPRVYNNTNTQQQSYSNTQKLEQTHKTAKNKNIPPIVVVDNNQKRMAERI